MAAFYRSRLADLLTEDSSRIIGLLTSHSQHSELQKRQIRAWEREIDVLQGSSSQLVAKLPEAADWTLLLEYPIPRRHKRLDAVLLAGDVVLCLEFKTEDKVHSLQARRQVEDYALDLRDFHEASRDRRIVPLAVVPRAEPKEHVDEKGKPELVRSVRMANASDLADVLISAYNSEHSAGSVPIDPVGWDNSPYHPVPTIIEAAEALFAGHDVREITHSHSGATNLTLTSDRLVEIIETAQRESVKVICFVTGIPGAGKTLTGLNVVHNPRLREAGRPAGVFLSGNGPLVRIVSRALARDHKRRTAGLGDERSIGTFIQNVHMFIGEYSEKSASRPPEQVVVFDEAQRAWNADQCRKKRGHDASEPELMLSIMNRHRGWAVIVALVGGGQEIHKGEAGLAEWGKALRNRFPEWRIAVSPEVLSASAATAGQCLFQDSNIGSLAIRSEPALHLNVNLRSFHAQRFPDWVDAVLGCDASRAASIAAELRGFPFAMTRSLPSARDWLRGRVGGLQRAGLVASSGALRLRPDGLELSTGFRQGNRDMFVHWFLSEPPDIRSSNQLEVAASEFECQGLELDWVGVCWGGDFCLDATSQDWIYRKFGGTRWKTLGNEVDRQYLLNKYRVLLTRSRRGFVVWVPSGDESDETRNPGLFNSTAEFLNRCGLPTI